MAGVQCMVSKGDLPIDIFWTLNKASIVSGQLGFVVARMNARTSALNIETLDAHHRGLYQCVARNKAGFFEIHAELRVNGDDVFISESLILCTINNIVCLQIHSLIPIPNTFCFRHKQVIPVIVPFSFGDEPAYPGDSNALNCMVTKGDLPLDIAWTLNGQVLRNGDRSVSIMRMKPRLSSLSIDALDGNVHRGVYGCVASNGAGEARSEAELFINGVFFDCHSVTYIQDGSLEFLNSRPAKNIIRFERVHNITICQFRR